MQGRQDGDLILAAALELEKAGAFSLVLELVPAELAQRVTQALSIPVIGMGGIMNAQDALEFIVSGATAVQIGTANLVNPYACQDIIQDIEKALIKMGIGSISELTGTLQLWD